MLVEVRFAVGDGASFAFLTHNPKIWGEVKIERSTNRTPVRVTAPDQMKEKSPASTRTRTQRAVVGVGGGDGGCSGRERELRIVATKARRTTFRLSLPPDWTVEERHRRGKSHYARQVDRYYYEPGTGRQFRSLVSVHKYLAGKCSNPISRKKSKTPVDKQIVPCNIKSNRSFELPEGWIVEEKPRNNRKVVDKYYIEPGTGFRFRSRVAVQRHLAAIEETATEPQALEQSDPFAIAQSASGDSSCRELVPFVNCSTADAWKPGPAPKTCSSVDGATEDRMLDFSTRPPKVNWVLSEPAGNVWIPFAEQAAIPGRIRHRWSQVFVSIIQDTS